MILPSKHLHTDRSLATIGARVIKELDEDRTVSELWARVQAAQTEHSLPLSFDRFTLSLSWLFAVYAIELTNSMIIKRASK